MKRLISLLILITYFLPINLAFSETSRETFDDWIVEIDIDDFSDKKYVGIASMGQINDRSYIYLALDENDKFRKISALMHNFDDHVCGDEDIDDTAEASFRIDKNEVINDRYNLSKDNQSGVRWTDRKKIKNIIDQMFTGENLIVRVFDGICGGYKDYKYSLSGFTDAYNYAISQL